MQCSCDNVVAMTLLHTGSVTELNLQVSCSHGSQLTPTSGYLCTHSTCVYFVVFCNRKKQNLKPHYHSSYSLTLLHVTLLSCLINGSEIILSEGVLQNRQSGSAQQRQEILS